MKKQSILIISILLLVLSINAIYGIGDTVNISHGPRLYYGDNPGYYFFRFAPEPYSPDIWRAGNVYRYIDTLTGEIGFCLHPQRAGPTGVMNQKAFFSHVPVDVLQRVELAVAIGFHDGIDGFMDEDLRYLFTQRYVWEHIPIEYYGWNSAYIGTKDTNILSWRFLDMAVNTSFNELYSEWEGILEERIEQALIRPSFSNDTFHMKKGEAYRAVDSRGRLRDYALVSAPEGVEVAFDGNTLVVSASLGGISGEIILGHRSFERGISYVYENDDPKVQDLGFFKVSAPLELRVFLEVDEDEGELEITKVEPSGESISGVVFGLYSDAGATKQILEATTDEEGKIILKSLKEGRYYLKELSVPSPFLLDSALRAVDIKAGEKGELLWQNERAKGRIEIEKLDAFDEEGLAGAVFSISQAGEEIEQLTSGKNGMAISSILPLGDYSVVEITPAPGYEKNEVPKEIRLEYTDSLTPIVTRKITIKNERIRVPLEVHKNSIIDCGLPLVGGAFDLYFLESAFRSAPYAKGDIIESLSINDEGNIVFQPLEPGVYALIETTAPIGYELNPLGTEYFLGRDGKWQQIAFNGEPLYEAYIEEIAKLNTLLDLQGGGHEAFEPLIFSETLSEASFYNSPKLSRLQLSKHLEENDMHESEEKRAEAGIAFRLENDLGEIVDRFVTSENGFATSNLLPQGHYTLFQETGSEGFALLEPMPIELGEQVLTLRLENAGLYSTIKIAKINAKTQEIIAQSGIIFSIFHEEVEGDPIGFHVMYPQEKTLTQFVTDESGTLTLPQKLAYGVYWLEEIQGPTGFFLDPEGGRVKITVESEHTLVEIENIPQYGVLELEKCGEQFVRWEEKNQFGYDIMLPKFEKKYLEGAHFVLEKNGEIIREFETADGVTRIENLDLGTYLLREVQVPHGYVLDETPYELVFTPQEPSLRFHLQSKSIQNARQRVHVTFSKKMESSLHVGKEAYEAVLFGLFNREELEGMSPDTLMGISNVNEKGEGSFEALLFGEYYLKELATHEAYVISDKEIPAVMDFVPEEGEARFLRVEVDENRLQRGNVRVVKVDAYNKMPLYGARFVIETEQNGERINLGESLTNEMGLIDWEFAYGKYFIREIEPPSGYLRSEHEWEIDIRGGEELLIDWENETTRLVIKKMDADNKSGLAAGFEILADGIPLTFIKREGVYWPDPSGKTKIYSDEKGMILILALPSGEYTLLEVDSPKGYHETQPVPFQLLDELELEVFNKAISTLPDTGDRTHITLRVASIVILFGVVIYLRRGKSVL